MTKQTVVVERPILFSGDMVRAILAGRKTQTRRLVKPQPVSMDAFWPDEQSHICWHDVHAAPEYYANSGSCPFGKTGNRIWVKETHVRLHEGLLAHLDPEPDNGATFNNGWRTAYRADGLPADWEHYGLKWKPSIFMRRQFSRINLEITGIRVERLQDISEEDSMAEGIKWFSKDGNLKKYWACDFCDGDLKCAWADLPRTAKEAYRALWNWLSLDPSPIYKTWHHPGLSKAEDSKSKEIEYYQCFPWSIEDFDVAYPGIRARGVYRGKPISITPNPWVWVIEFKSVESAKSV